MIKPQPCYVLSAKRHAYGCYMTVRAPGVKKPMRKYYLRFSSKLERFCRTTDSFHLEQRAPRVYKAAEEIAREYCCGSSREAVERMEKPL